MTTTFVRKAVIYLGAISGIFSFAFACLFFGLGAGFYVENIGNRFIPNGLNPLRDQAAICLLISLLTSTTAVSARLSDSILARILGLLTLAIALYFNVIVLKNSRQITYSAWLNEYSGTTLILIPLFAPFLLSLLVGLAGLQLSRFWYSQSRAIK
jgi:hypothetical protein